LLESAGESGVVLRTSATRTEALTTKAAYPELREKLRRLGLLNQLEELSREFGRPVDIMIFETVEGATARGASRVIR
jgi:hypothetical protein